MRLIASMALCLVAPLCALTSARTIVVTKTNQQQEGVEFTLTTERHPDATLDTVFVKLVFAKKGKLERLNEVTLQIKDGDVLALRVPLSLKEHDGTWSGTFHRRPPRRESASCDSSAPRPFLHP